MCITLWTANVFHVPAGCLGAWGPECAAYLGVTVFWMTAAGGAFVRSGSSWR
jgi:hypothetical protein